MRRIAGIGLVGALLLAGCVDHESNAAKFCKRIEDRLTTPINDQGVPVTLPPEEWSSEERKPLRDEVEHLETSFNKAMKFSEDATKDIRKSARRVDKSYLDIFTLVEEEDSKQRQLKERRVELVEHLAELKDRCAEFL